MPGSTERVPLVTMQMKDMEGYGTNVEERFLCALLNNVFSFASSASSSSFLAVSPGFSVGANVSFPGEKPRVDQVGKHWDRPYGS